MFTIGDLYYDDLFQSLSQCFGEAHAHFIMAMIFWLAFGFIGIVGSVKKREFIKHWKIIAVFFGVVFLLGIYFFYYMIVIKEADGLLMGLLAFALAFLAVPYYNWVEKKEKEQLKKEKRKQKKNNQL